MTLFVSDLHFEAHKSGTREAERDLASLVGGLGESLDRIVLLGDLFDAYIEYPSLVPKPPVRLLGTLARCADAGIRIDYLAGNHDPWHRNWFEEEVGAVFSPRSIRIDCDGLVVHAEHGDAAFGRDLARRVTRNPLALKLYSAILPGDSGQRLASWVSRNMRKRSVSPDIPERMAEYAAELLEPKDVGGVVMGHTHRADERHLNGGTYVNCGSWLDQRTYALVDNGVLSLQKWKASD